MSERAQPHLPLLTDRLELRDFGEADVEWVQAWACDPAVVRFMPWGPNTREQPREFLQRKFAARTGVPRRTWDLAVVNRSTGRLIGSAGLRLDGGLQQAELGYCFHRDAWGHGFATEAARELPRCGFEQLGLHRIDARVDSRNGASVRVLARIGMRQEGWLREHLMQRGEWRDSFLFAILKREWDAAAGAARPNPGSG